VRWIAAATTIKSADVDRQRRGRIVATMALGMLLVSLVSVPTAFIQANVAQELLTYAIGSFLFIVSGWLARRGRVDIAGALIVGTISLGIFLLMLSSGNTLTLPYYLSVSVLIASIVLRARYLAVVVLANLAGLVLTLIASGAQLSSISSRMAFIDHVTITVIVALLGYIGNVTIQRAIAAAQQAQARAETLSAVLERRVAERTAVLQEREARYRDIAELTSDFVFTGVFRADGTARLTWTSEAVARITGYTFAEIEPHAAWWMSQIHADDKQAVLECIVRLRAGEETTYEFRLLTKDGRTRWLRTYARPQRSGDGSQVVGFLGGAQDITEHREAEDALRRSEATKSAILAAVPDLMFHMRGDGRILAVHANAVGGLPAAPQALVGRPLHALFPPEIAEQTARTIRQTLQTGEVQHFEYQLPDGDAMRYWEARAAVIGDDEVLVLVRDVTERTRSEISRLEMERSMLHMQKLESLGVLAGGIAHDFNNLLTGILGNAELLSFDIGHKPTLREPLAQIEHSARRAAELTQQILAYAGKGRFMVEPVRLNLVITEMPQLLETLLPKAVALHLDLDPNLPAINADAAQLRQVVLNLLINAGEAMSTAGGTINCATGVRSLDAATLAEAYRAPELPAGAYVELRVQDDGGGMDARTLARMFDPFFTTKFTGRGLGLAAVQGIVRSHGGAIHVRSAVGVGTTFSLLFPPWATPAASKPADTGSSSLEPGKGSVLVVDDEEPIRTLAKRLLERQGFHVLTATDGQDGVDLLRANADRVVCVLLDLTMPRLAGAEALVAMRQISPTVPVVVMSGYSAETVSQQFANVAALRCLQKPFTVQEMWDQLREVDVV
jgi:PAS domain S-box-containing protein